MRQCNDLSVVNGRADFVCSLAADKEVEQLQCLKENYDIVGDPAHHKHTHYSKYQLYSFVLFGVSTLVQHNQDFHIAENHDGEAQKKAHRVLSEVSQHLPKSRCVLWIERLTLDAVIIRIHLQGGKDHLRGRSNDGYDPDGDAGYDSIVKGPGSHGCNSVDDGQVAVHAHQGYKHCPTVETQLNRGAERGAESEQDVVYSDRCQS